MVESQSARVQMCMSDKISVKYAIILATPFTLKGLEAAAGKKFRSYKPGRGCLYNGITGQEISDDVAVASIEACSEAFVVVNITAEWKGARQLRERHEQAIAHVKQDAETAESTNAFEDQAPSLQLDWTLRQPSSALIDAAKVRRQNGVVLFWKDTQDNGYLSNWAWSRIIIDDVEYNCVEQWLMASKARYSKGGLDETSLQKIMASRDQGEMKKLGSEVDLDTRAWDSNKENVQIRGALAKFQQNERLAEKLLRTGEKLIAEASPSDCIFGIGLAPNDPKAQDPNNWRGKNILGRALMYVRTTLRDVILSPNGIAVECGQQPPFTDDTDTQVFGRAPQEARGDLRECVTCRCCNGEGEVEHYGSCPLCEGIGWLADPVE